MLGNRCDNAWCMPTRGEALVWCLGAGVVALVVTAWLAVIGG